MYNNNLKRRRPYSHEDAPAEAHPSLPAGTDASSLSPDHRYILQQAAHILNVDPSQLLDIRRQQDPQYVLEQAASILNVPESSLRDLSRTYVQPGKRPRLNSEMPMSSPYPASASPQDVDEKSPPVPPPARGGSHPARSVSVLGETGSMLAGWSHSKIAECFATFCQPGSGYESDSGYQPIPVTASYEYAGGGNALPPAMTSPAHENAHDAFVAPAAAQTDQAGGLFACDDPALVASYMQSYPPLQPTRVAADQPTTRREGMFYPSGLPNNHYFEAGGDGPELAPSGLRPEPVTMDGRQGYPGDLMQVASSPTMPHQAVMSNPPPRYGVLQGYDSSDSFIQDGRSGLQLSQAESNLDVVFPNQKAPAAKRGPFKDHLERQKTAQTRKIGSCIRCRMQRIRCNADPENNHGACVGCKKVSSKIYRLPCLRLKINDVVLSKSGQVEGFEWTLRWKENMALDDIGIWASSEIKTIRVTEGYTGQHVELKVRKFVPQEGDRLERSWVAADGMKRSVRIPPYAIVDLDAAKAEYDNYIKRGLVECFKKLLGPREKLLWRTYALALKLTGDPSLGDKERELLASTLNLWMSNRLTTKSCEIVGEETLGMPRNILGDAGAVPVPPVMGAQIDSILINQIQTKLRHNTLENLQKLTTENKQKTWLVTYLVTFILLHNVGLLMKHDAGYALKHGIKRRFAREDKVKQYHQGAITFLAYFHYCNKGIFPFSEECKDQDLKSLAELDDKAVQFVRDTRAYAIQHKNQWQQLWDSDDYKNDYYFVSQLYEQNWQPRAMV